MSALLYLEEWHIRPNFGPLGRLARQVIAILQADVLKFLAGVMEDETGQLGAAT